MKKKNGFTLIELLVTIALMLSILGIAIISFINISDKKKEESWKKVKEQVEDAAIEYFVSNEYLFESLSDGASGSISVGQLVKDDYLNKVINPVTGKSIDECTKIEVKKSGNKYKASYTNEKITKKDGVCINENLVIVSEVGAPKVELNQTCDNEGINKWCKGIETIELKILKKYGTITSLLYCKGNSSCDPTKDLTNYKVTDEENGENRIAKFKIENQKGTTIASVSYKIDSVAPENGKIEITPKDTWPSKNVNIKLYASDKTSGLDTFIIDGTNYFNESNKTLQWSSDREYSFKDVDYKNINNKTRKVYGKITDQAGNEADVFSNEYTLYTACKDENRIEVGKWYNKKGAKCSNKCGGEITQEISTKDKNSGTKCDNKERNIACGGTKTPDSDNVAKAYKFTAIKGDTKHCKIDNTLTMQDVKTKKEHVVTGPYRKYEYQEIKCNCTVSTIDDTYCEYKDYDDITNEGHVKKDNKYYSYIIYKNNKNGVKSCNSEDNKKNTYVEQICIHGIYDNKSKSIDNMFEYHGWYWHTDSAKTRHKNEEDNTFKSGWYVNGSKKGIYSSSYSTKMICEKACQSKYN